MPKPLTSPIEAFGVRAGTVVALIGAGGKTTLAAALSKDAHRRGWKVVSTVTTKTQIPSEHPPGGVMMERNPDARLEGARRRLAEHRYAFVVSHLAEPAKFAGVEIEWIDRVRPLADLVVVEADGSRRKPLKAHDEHEPAVPASAELVVAVVGADALGERFTQDVVHRWEKFAVATGLKLGQPLDPAVMARYAASDAYFARVPESARRVVFLNKASSAPRERVEAFIAASPQGTVWGDAAESRFVVAGA